MHRYDASYRVVMVYAVVSAFCVTAALAQPTLYIRHPWGSWCKEVTTDAKLQGTTLYMDLTAPDGSDGGGTSWDPDSGDESGTITFSGPTGGNDYSVAYFVDGVQQDNPFSLTMASGETETIRAEVYHTGAPDRYLFAMFTATDSAGDSDSVGANLIVPGNLMVKKSTESEWLGADSFAADVPPWSGSEIPNAVSRSMVTYDLKLVNVQNAYASYALRARRQTANGFIARYFLDGQQITDAICSGSGYRTALLDPGEQLNVEARLTGVGSDPALREVSVSAAVVEVEFPDLGLGFVVNDVNPFAVHLADIPEQQGTTMTLYDKSTLAPGCFGLLNLDGGPVNVPELRDYIEEGYDGVIVSQEPGYEWVEAATGWKATLIDAMDLKVQAGAMMRALVFDQATGTGDNTDVRVVGVIDFIPTACDSDSITIQFERFTLLRDLVVGSLDAVNFGVRPRAAVSLENWRELP